ncbi:MAG: Asp-tRNA(Asn)/Glu-tRNA(Gln) amidotransferase subunit GatC [Candidatus Bathyarchaeia archaeon]
MRRQKTATGLAQIEHLAWLARIELTKTEKALFSKQLGEIIAYFSKVDEVDTEGVEPTYHVLDMANVFRPDEPRPTDVEPILRNVPERKDTFVKAPRMG